MDRNEKKKRRELIGEYLDVSNARLTHTFTDDIGIREDYQYRDDDGQTGASSREIRDARGILNWFRDHR